MPLIKLFANLRKIAGQKEIAIPGATVQDVLNTLVEQHPGLEGVLWENGQVRPNIIITINGQNCPGSDVAVTEQDTIAIFPPIAGG